MMLMEGDRDLATDFSTEVERVFHRHYLGNLSEIPPFVRLESEVFS